MEKIDHYVLQEILSFLDFTSLNNCRLISRDFNKAIFSPTFFNYKSAYKNQSRLYSGPYFKFQSAKVLINDCSSFNYKLSSYKDLQTLYSKLANPQKLSIKTIKASSEDNTQVASDILNNDENFWSSLPNDSDLSNEFLICELENESLVYSVNFNLYRAIYQDGTIYPPKFVKVLIGKEPEKYDFETEEFEVGFSENYNTILILPTIVLGKFVKIEFIGKRMKEPGTEKWYTVLRYLEIIGNDENRQDKYLDICKNGVFDESDNEILRFSPFYLERLEKFGKIPEYLNFLPHLFTDISAYFYELFCLSHGLKEKNKRFCEILGNHFLSLNKFISAREHYVRIIDFWGFSKLCIVAKGFVELARIMDESNVRRPNYRWVLKTAKEIGGSELEATAKEALMSILPEEVTRN